MNKPTVAKTKNFVRTHIPHIVAVVSVVTTVGVAYHYGKETLLVVPTGTTAKLKDGGAIVYEVAGENLYLLHESKIIMSK